ncbi:MAG: glycyl-radical enzyme activating protein [Clostridia bacterium]|nr:glycyl-radical enzyme activating protein [Clostridia bacterium]
MTETKALITDIQRFSLNDGPGIRTTVFFKGCNMRCAWCHNPETLSFQPDLMHYPAKCVGCGRCFAACPAGAHRLENGRHVIDRALCRRCGACAEACWTGALVMTGREMTVEEILFEARQDKAYYDASGGGVTLSGGEVGCHAAFAAALARACRREGISVALETNLSLPWEEIAPLLAEADLVMADLKLWDDEAHRRYTGASNRAVLENLRRLEDVPLIVRTPLIPGVTATAENLRAVAAFLRGKKNLLYYQLLNFNPLGAAKYESLSAPDAFAGKKPYGDAEMAAFAALLADSGVPVKAGE